MKKKHGGRRIGAGRPPSNKDFGARSKTSYTIRQDQYEALQAMPSQQKNACLDAGLSISIPSFQQGTAPGQLECLIVYNAISEAITSLERARDINPESGMTDEENFFWSPEQEAIHTLLSGFWDSIRNHECFTEPQLEHTE